MSKASEREALARVPLRQNVRWVDLAPLFPGYIAEEERDPATGKFGTIDFGDAEAAAEIVRIHNLHFED